MIDILFPTTLAGLKPGDHLCCLYETEQEHQAVLTPFLRQGLERGEKVLYIVDAHAAEAVLGYLRADGLDVEPYLACGQLAILTSDETYTREGVFDPGEMIALLKAETEATLAEGYPALRVTGEMTWVLRGLPGSERLIEYEARLNEFFPGSHCLAICQYDRRRFKPALLLDVLHTHPIAVVGTGVYDNFYYIPPTELLGGDLPATELRHWMQNLAKRKQVEEALKESENKLRSILLSMADLIFIFDDEGRFTLYHSPADEELYVPPEQFIGKKHAEVMPPYLNELFEEAFESNKRGEVAEYEYWLEMGGETRGYSAKVSPMFLDGKFRGSVGVIRDITARKRAEEALRESKEKYRLLVENATVTIVVAQDGMLKFFNPEAMKITGYSREELASKPFIGLIHPDDREMTVEYYLKFLKGEETPPSYTVRIIGKEGGIKWLESNAVLIIWEGRPATLNFLSDITAHKQAEEEIERLYQQTLTRAAELAALNRASQAITSSLDIREVLSQIVNLAGSMASAAWTSVVLVEADGSLGLSAENFREIPPIETKARPQGITRQIIASRQPLVFDAVADDGTHNPALLAAGVRSYAGLPLIVKEEVLGVLFVHSRAPGAFRERLRLLTTFANQAAIAIENARLFEQVHAGRGRLQALSLRLVETQEAERRRIARELHDEVGQLLTGLKLTLEMSTQPPADLAWDRMGEAHALITDLMARVRQLSLDLRPAMLDDLGLLPTLLWHFERYANQTNVHVTFKHTGLEGRRFPPEVETAAYRIVQEALTNVARHAGVGEVTVRVWASQDRVSVQAEDQGAGFDPEVALAATKTAGLTGMRERAVLLGGQLTIESAPGAGTHLTAELPLCGWLDRRKQQR
jgi:PAS domain S-box-containing protein